MFLLNIIVSEWVALGTGNDNNFYYINNNVLAKLKNNKDP